jgi:hypothetical protein
MSTAPALPGTALLASDTRPGGWDVGRVVLADRSGRGAMPCACAAGGPAARARVGGARPLEARSTASRSPARSGDHAGTSAEEAEAHLEAARAWAGLRPTTWGLRRLRARPSRSSPSSTGASGRTGCPASPRRARRSAAPCSASSSRASRPAARPSRSRRCAAGGPGGLWTWPTPGAARARSTGGRCAAAACRCAGPARCTPERSRTAARRARRPLGRAGRAVAGAAQGRPLDVG